MMACNAISFLCSSYLSKLRPCRFTVLTETCCIQDVFFHKWRTITNGLGDFIVQTCFLETCFGEQCVEEPTNLPVISAYCDVTQGLFCALPMLLCCTHGLRAIKFTPSKIPVMHPETKGPGIT